LPAYRGETIGQMVDAIAYLGLVPDTVVEADLTQLKAKYGAEFARRERLLAEAEKRLAK
jgi:hypothetical protein